MWSVAAADAEEGWHGKSVDGGDRPENGEVGLHQVTKMSADFGLDVKKCKKTVFF